MAHRALDDSHRGFQLLCVVANHEELNVAPEAKNLQAPNVRATFAHQKRYTFCRHQNLDYQAFLKLREAVVQAGDRFAVKTATATATETEGIKEQRA